MLTGVRLSIGTAWLVIVAAEMLTGGVGIGFWVWDEWNNLNVPHIIIAIFAIGMVGLLLEQALVAGPRIHLRRRQELRTGPWRPHGKFIDIQDADMVLQHPQRRIPRAARHQPDRAQGRVHHADRPLGLRQVHAAEPDRRPALPSSGALLCANREIAGPAPERAVVFQNHSLLPWLTCFENVYLGVERCSAPAKVKAQLKERTAAALALVGLAHAQPSARMKSRAA
jgi:hypothetical protein